MNVDSERCSRSGYRKAPVFGYAWRSVVSEKHQECTLPFLRTMRDRSTAATNVPSPMLLGCATGNRSVARKQNKHSRLIKPAAADAFLACL
jgi:hypothetical protein